MSQLFAATYESLPTLWRLGRGHHSEEATATPGGRIGDSTSVPQASVALGFLCCFSSPLCVVATHQGLSSCPGCCLWRVRLVYKAPGGLEILKTL